MHARCGHRLPCHQHAVVRVHDDERGGHHIATAQVFNITLTLVWPAGPVYAKPQRHRQASTHCAAAPCLDPPQVPPGEVEVPRCSGLVVTSSYRGGVFSTSARPNRQAKGSKPHPAGTFGLPVLPETQRSVCQRLDGPVDERGLTAAAAGPRITIVTPGASGSGRSGALPRGKRRQRAQRTCPAVGSPPTREGVNGTVPAPARTAWTGAHTSIAGLGGAAAAAPLVPPESREIGTTLRRQGRRPASRTDRFPIKAG